MTMKNAVETKEALHISHTYEGQIRPALTMPLERMDTTISMLSRLQGMQ